MGSSEDETENTNNALVTMNNKKNFNSFEKSEPLKDENISYHNGEIVKAEFGNSGEKKVKFTIDINTLKADMKRKSAKLLSKLTVSSNNSSLVKNLVKDISTNEKSSDLAEMCSVTNSNSPIEAETSIQKLDLNELSITGDWFSRVQFRCESKNTDFKLKIDELRSKLCGNKNANSIGKH